MKLHLVLLAAGQSKRFKAIKQLASVHGKPLINHTLDNYQQDGKLLRGINKLSLVLGANAQKIRPVLPSDLAIFYAADWQQGMGSSIAFAVSQLGSDVSHVCIALADQLALTRQDMQLLLDKSTEQPEKIIAAYYQDSVGAPAIFPRRYFPELESLVGDKGAKVILQRHPESLVPLALPHARIDIDTADDLQSWLRSNSPLSTML